MLNKSCGYNSYTFYHNFVTKIPHFHKIKNLILLNTVILKIYLFLISILEIKESYYNFHSLYCNYN